MSNPQVFVSYNRADEDFKNQLVEDLQSAGADVWVDVNDISHGNFMRRIDEALAKCEWMVLILSPHAITSDYVAEETYTALHRVKQGFMRGVIPILASPCATGSIPPQWDALQRYDATRNYGGAVAGLLRAIGLSPAPSAKPPANTKKEASPSHRTPPKRVFRCSFCGKSNSQVKRLISGPGSVYICDECIELCTEILVEEGDWEEYHARPLPPAKKQP